MSDLARTREVCRADLARRIAAMEGKIKAAKALLRAGNLLQCAVRLEHAADDARFDPLLMNVFDSVGVSDD